HPVLVVVVQQDLPGGQHPWRLLLGDGLGRALRLGDGGGALFTFVGFVGLFFLRHGANSKERQDTASRRRAGLGGLYPPAARRERREGGSWAKERFRDLPPSAPSATAGLPSRVCRWRQHGWASQPWHGRRHGSET